MRNRNEALDHLFKAYAGISKSAQDLFAEHLFGMESNSTDDNVDP
jgi:hypothetical protein